MKVLPIMFQKRWREYFGKKRPSLHINIFFLKKNNRLFKRLYFSSINHYDQGMIDTLSLGKAVLK